ncbi:MAG: hypothetical protein ACE5RH_04170, partial [Nitrosarchaeum sp.]
MYLEKITKIEREMSIAMESGDIDGLKKIQAFTKSNDFKKMFAESIQAKNRLNKITIEIKQFF